MRGYVRLRPGQCALGPLLKLVKGGWSVAEVHKLILEHGREKAREMVPTKHRHLVDVAAEVMAADEVALGITYAGWCITALPRKRLPDTAVWTRTTYNCTLLVE